MVRVPDITAIVSGLAVAIELCKQVGEAVGEAEEQGFRVCEETQGIVGDRNPESPGTSNDASTVTIDRHSWHVGTWAQ
jgi:hypothetical protein